MLTVILIIYSIAAIVMGIMTYCTISEYSNDNLWIAIIFSLFTGAIFPLLVGALITISLLPIIIPCITLIYLYG